MGIATAGNGVVYAEFSRSAITENSKACLHARGFTQTSIPRVLSRWKADENVFQLRRDRRLSRSIMGALARAARTQGRDGTNIRTTETHGQAQIRGRDNDSTAFGDSTPIPRFNLNTSPPNRDTQLENYFRPNWRELQNALPQGIPLQQARPSHYVRQGRICSRVRGYVRGGRWGSATAMAPSGYRGFGPQSSSTQFPQFNRHHHQPPNMQNPSSNPYAFNPTGNGFPGVGNPADRGSIFTPAIHGAFNNTGGQGVGSHAAQMGFLQGAAREKQQAHETAGVGGVAYGHSTRIREVWKGNLESEMALIRSLLAKYNHVSMV